MGRTKGSKNNNSAAPSFVDMSAEERINFLANLIVDKATEDLENGQSLLKKIEEETHAPQPANT